MGTNGTFGISCIWKEREDNRASFGGNAGKCIYTNDIGTTSGSWVAQDAPVDPYKQKQQVTDNHSASSSLRSHRPQYVARRSTRVSSALRVYIVHACAPDRAGYRYIRLYILSSNYPRRLKLKEQTLSKVPEMDMCALERTIKQIVPYSIVRFMEKT